MAAEDTWNWDDPLARYGSETIRANAAFQDYVDLGPGRSLKRLWDGYTGQIKLGQPWFEKFRVYAKQTGGGPDAKPPTARMSTLVTWSSDYQWQARLARLQQIETEERAAIRAARRAELEDRDWNQGRELREKVGAFLEELPRFLSDTVQEVKGDGETIRVVTVKLNTTLDQIARAAKVASELQRLSINEPTDITELHGSALLARLVSELDSLVEAGQDDSPGPADDPGTEGAPGGGDGPEGASPDPEGPAGQ